MGIKQFEHLKDKYVKHEYRPYQLYIGICPDSIVVPTIDPSRELFGIACIKDGDRTHNIPIYTDSGSNDSQIDKFLSNVH